MNIYTADDLDKIENIEYPYIEKQSINNEDYFVYINSFRSEDWFGYRGWLRKVKDPIRARYFVSNAHYPRYQKMIKKGDTVFDCGANEGYFSLIYSKIVGESGKVIAFEPDPSNIEVMKKTLALNNINNVIIEQKAVSNKSNETVLFGAEVIQKESDKNYFEVTTVKLDDYAHYNPNFIKVDVEGYELPVVEGSSNILKTKAMWEIELHLSRTTGIHMKLRFGFDPDLLYKIFKNRDFSITYLGKEVQYGDEPDGCVYCRKKEAL